jgi:mutual gliding-motility protein MglA
LSFINFAAREINCKIVYYGAGLGGKTTNLQVIYQKTAEQQKGKMISLATETERTLFFDFLPLDLGSVRGFKTRIHLYTVPGQVFYAASMASSLSPTRRPNARTPTWKPWKT